MADYKQIAQNGEAEIVIKGSRFICALARVETVEDAQQFIKDKKKEHKHATHNCSAFLIGETDNIQRANDDGEPSGTAGVPMLDVLKKNELHYIVAVVTRYFGGTKLGVGGLIRAYSTSVSHALNELGIIMHTEQSIFNIHVPYTLSGKFEYWLTQSPYELLDTQYSDVIIYRCGVLTTQENAFKQNIMDTFQSKLEPLFSHTHYIDLPIETDTITINEDDFN